MSPFRLGLIGLSCVAILASLGLWQFFPGFPRSLEVLTYRPGAALPSLWHPLYAALSGVFYVVTVGLACTAAIAASRTSDFAPLGRTAVALAGLTMALGGFAVAFTMQRVQSIVQVAVMSEFPVKPDELLSGLSMVLPTMQAGRALLCLPPIGLLLCGLIGYRAPDSESRRTRISWLHAIGLLITGTLAALAFAAAIPPALHFPQLLSSQQPIKASEVVMTVQQLLSTGLLSGLLFAMYGLVILLLGAFPSGPSRRTAVPQ